jgi:putative transferase (TIGR04331 family)
MHLALRQFPQFWSTPKFEVSAKIDRTLRENLCKSISINSADHFESIASSLLFELLPICYLEGFKNLRQFVDRQPWPKAPKFILTSNNFDTDEIFKLWTSTKVEYGYKYIVGQHGNYGVSRNHLNPSIEEVTADKFLTWGWTDGLPQHRPTFIFKTIRWANKIYDPNGGLLLIELHLNHRITTWDVFSEFSHYFRNQIDFVSNLGFAPKQSLTIRLHSWWRSLRWSEESRWRDYDPMLKIETGERSIKDLIAHSRLVIHSYDSTGILETLSLNIPTLAFWESGYDNLRESARPYYRLLVDAGIVHFSPQSAASKVNEIWSDVNAWWWQAEVQNARKMFCERYAKISTTPVEDILKICLE